MSYHSTTHAGKSQSLQMDEKTDSEHQQQQQGHQAYINSMCDSEASDSFGDDQAKRDEYTALLKKLFAVNRSHVVKYGVDNTQDLCNVLPPAYSGKTFPIIHVAGTNGKGSVCLKIARTLEQLGLKVGLFASPHISSFRERMSINGDYISETQVQVGLHTQINADTHKYSCTHSFAYMLRVDILTH